MKLEGIALWSEQKLFCEQENGKYGYLGFVRGTFGENDPNLNTTQINMNSETQYEFQTVLCFLLSEEGHYLFKSRNAMEIYCREHLQSHIPYAYNRECYGFRVLTQSRVWYIACTPWNEKRQFCIYLYDRNALMTALANERGLPESCYGVNPFDGVRVRIRFGDNAFEEFPQYGSNRQENEKFVAEQNRELKITKPQLSAMLCGVFYGWESPYADVGNYDKDGYFVPTEEKHKK